jgi:FMN-dependent NADH-azoreductase
MSHLLHLDSSPGTPRDGWDHREPWPRHALSTLARESPAMIPLVLGDAEDKSMADALAAIDALVEV